MRSLVVRHLQYTHHYPTCIWFIDWPDTGQTSLQRFTLLHWSRSFYLLLYWDHPARSPHQLLCCQPCLPAGKPAPWQWICQHWFRPDGFWTAKFAAVSCSAITIAVLVCKVGSVQVTFDSPSAIAMNMISWSCNLQAGRGNIGQARLAWLMWPITSCMWKTISTF